MERHIEGCSRLFVGIVERSSRKDFQRKIEKIGVDESFFLSPDAETELLQPYVPTHRREEILTSEARRIIVRIRDEFNHHDRLQFLGEAYFSRLKQARYKVDGGEDRDILVLRVLERTKVIYDAQNEYGHRGTPYKSLLGLLEEFKEMKSNRTAWDSELEDKLKSMLHVMRLGNADGTAGARIHKNFVQVGQQKADGNYYYFTLSDGYFDIGTKVRKGNYKKIGEFEGERRDEKMMWYSRLIIDACAKEILGRDTDDIRRFLDNCKVWHVEEDI